MSAWLNKDAGERVLRAAFQVTATSAIASMCSSFSEILLPSCLHCFSFLYIKTNILHLFFTSPSVHRVGPSLFLQEGAGHLGADAVNS